MSLAPGDIARLSYGPLLVDDVATDATVVLTVTTPAGVTSSPTVTHTGTGTYQADYLTTTAGTYTYRWVASGAATDVEDGTFGVGSTVISLADVKARLDKTLNVDDGEIHDMLLAAEAEYVEWVGPLAGSVTERHDGGSDRLVLRSPHVREITAAAYTDGTAISLTDLDLDTETGIVYWGYGTAGRFLWGSRNVTLTYTVAAAPANHREAIIADVAGYFAATQRGPLGPDDDGYSGAFTASPTVLFPRIRALAPPRVG